MPLLEYIQLSK